MQRLSPLFFLLILPATLLAQIEPANPAAEEAESFSGPTAADDGISINPQLLAGVRDRTFGLTWAEREPYFRILAQARTVELGRQRAAARDFQQQRREAVPAYRKRPAADFPAFFDLFKHPDLYRGRPVTLHGHVRKLVPMPPGEHPYPHNVPMLYEAWLYTDDSQGNPAVVVFTEKPDGLPEGGDLAEEVTVTGYFYKMYAYDAQDTTRIAPMLLAGGVTWHPAPPVGWGPTPPWVYAVITLAVLLLITVVWRINRHDRRHKRRPLHDTESTAFMHPDETDI
jgi:hypothetical protein